MLNAIIGNAFHLAASQGMSDAEAADYIEQQIKNKFAIFPTTGEAESDEYPDIPFPEPVGSEIAPVIPGAESWKAVEIAIVSLFKQARVALFSADLAGEFCLQINISSPVTSQSVLTEYKSSLRYENVSGNNPHFCLSETLRRAIWNRRNEAKALEA